MPSLVSAPISAADTPRDSEGSGYVDASIKVALSLYKVQQNIYLLDFQKVEVSKTNLMSLFIFVNGTHVLG